MSKCLICGCTDEQACPGGCSWWVKPTDLDLGVCSKCKDFTRANVLEKLLGCIDTWADVPEEKIKLDNLKVVITELMRTI